MGNEDFSKINSIVSKVTDDPGNPTSPEFPALPASPWMRKIHLQSKEMRECLMSLENVILLLVLIYTRLK